MPTPSPIPEYGDRLVNAKDLSSILSASHRKEGDSPSPPQYQSSPELCGGSGQFDDQQVTIIAGKYTLLELIGEGGMGSVHLAEQSEPVKRQVALKFIKTGLDSKVALARFDAERHALARMDHPNIPARLG